MTLNYPLTHRRLSDGKETMMRKPRDYDAELKALDDKQRELKARKVHGLGELVIATGADALTTEELAGALLVLAETQEVTKREAWAKRGAVFFRGKSRRAARTAERDGSSPPPQPDGVQPARGHVGEA